MAADFKAQERNVQASWLSTENFDYIICRGIELVRFLDILTIQDGINYLLAVVMFQVIHGIT